jgi:hypothetical protein
MKSLITTLLLTAISLPAFSYTECELTPDKVWLDLSSNSVWVCFEGPACIYKTQSETVTEAHLDRFYSTALASISRGSMLRVRYPEDNANCDDLASQIRNDIQGLWFLK